MARVIATPGGERQLADAGPDLLRRVALAIVQDAKRFAPVDTGALRAGIEAEKPRGNSVRIYTRRPVPGDDPNVPIFVEYGTAAHVIEAPEGEALDWPGAAHPVRRVNHPGTPAQPYMRPALFRKRVV